MLFISPQMLTAKLRGPGDVTSAELCFLIKPVRSEKKKKKKEEEEEEEK